MKPKFEGYIRPVPKKFLRRAPTLKELERHRAYAKTIHRNYRLCVLADLMWHIDYIAQLKKFLPKIGIPDEHANKVVEQVRKKWNL